MGKIGKLLISLVVVGAAAGGALLIMNKKDAPSASDQGRETTQNSGTENESPTEQPTDTPTPAAATATITYNGRSFSLSSSTITSGGKVTVVNNSNEDLEFQSDPHPVHTDNPELNVGEVAPGESATITLTTKGTWGFHNHLDHDQAGTITVK